MNNHKAIVSTTTHNSQCKKTTCINGHTFLTTTLSVKHYY